MAVDSTLLMREVDAIVEQGEGLGNYKLQARILAGTEWIDPQRVEFFSLTRDYESGYGDIIILEVMVGRGTYAYRLIPHRDRLFVDITTTPLYLNSDASRSDTPTRTRRYRAVLMDQDNPALVGRSPIASSEDDLNTSGPRVVQFQLVEEGIYQTRMMSVGRIYRDDCPMNALRALLTETGRFRDGNNRRVIQGVDVAEGYNTAPRRHIVIPDGTPLMSVPTLLQEEEGGLYSTGVGCYLQGDHWYVYPLYDLTRFRKTPRTLTVLNVPANRFMGAEKTFRQTANQLVVVAAGDMTQQDPGLYNQLNQGNAVRFTNADRLLEFVQTGGNKAVAQRDLNVLEFEGMEMKAGLTHARWSAQRAVSNQFKYLSELSKRNGRVVQVQWLHGDAQLLYPGMPVKFLTNADGTLKTLYGTLLGVDEQRVPRESGVAAQQYPASVTLIMFLERLVDI